MISPFLKIILRPIVRSFDALLDRLQSQIRDGKKEEAMSTVVEIREAIKALTKYIE